MNTSNTATAEERLLEKWLMGQIMKFISDWYFLYVLHITQVSTEHNLSPHPLRCRWGLIHCDHSMKQITQIWLFSNLSMGLEDPRAWQSTPVFLPGKSQPKTHSLSPFCLSLITPFRPTGPNVVADGHKWLASYSTVARLSGHVSLTSKASYEEK